MSTAGSALSLPLEAPEPCHAETLSEEADSRLAQGVSPSSPSERCETKTETTRFALTALGDALEAHLAAGACSYCAPCGRECHVGRPTLGALAGVDRLKRPVPSVVGSRGYGGEAGAVALHVPKRRAGA